MVAGPLGTEVRLCIPWPRIQFRRNAAFFESYFSNFIEGTEFDVGEAQRIVFDGYRPEHRIADTHDILGTYECVNKADLAQKLPGHYEEFVELLKRRQRTIMACLPNMSPSVFNEVKNRGGATVFVAPEQVEGTLYEGFRIGSGLEHPLAVGIFMRFLVSEVHPFNDGNGRVSRLFLNAPLDSAFSAPK